MKRSFNYTDRVRIARKDVSIRLLEVLDERPNLEVRTDLSGYGFEFGSVAYLEGHNDTAWERHKLADPLIPHAINPVALSEFSEIGNVKFKIKVVDPSADARLLGLADNIPLVNPADVVGDPDGLLLVRWSDIGQQIWKLDFDPAADGKPELLLSRRLREHEKKLSGDPMFRGCVLPEVFRRILEQAIIVYGYDADDDRSWFSDWIGWMRSVPSIGVQVDTLLDASGDYEKRSAIEDAVNEFADQRANSFLDKLLVDMEIGST